MKKLSFILFLVLSSLVSAQPIIEKKCKTCGKKLSECPSHGQHPIKPQNPIVNKPNNKIVTNKPQKQEPYIERTETKQPGEEYEIKGKFGSSGLALVKLRGKYGFINKEGKEVVPLMYDGIESSHWIKEQGWDKYILYIAVKKNQKWGLIDTNHNIIVPCIYDKIENFRESQYMIRANKDGKYGTIDQTGNIVLPFEYDDIQHYFYWEDKGFPIFVKKQGMYGYVDENNTVLIPFKYSTAKSFGTDHKFAPVSINGKYGFIDMMGDEVIPLQYDFSESFYSGLAAVVKNGKAGFIDTKGEVIIPFKYTPDYASEGNGKAFQFSFEEAGVALVKKGVKWGIINKDGHELTEFKYDSYHSLGSSGDYTLGINGKKVFLDKWGSEYDTEEQRIAGRKNHLIIDAESGDALAQYELGYLYYHAKDSEKDYEKAIYWFNKAADQGNADAQFYLGVMYYNGYGVTKDYEEAVKWYRKAANQGDASAQFNLGVMYYNGDGVTKDYEEAVKWYRKAANQGKASAQFNLGVMYEYGYGVTKDYEEAVKWYRKAAEQGNASAKSALERLNTTGFTSSSTSSSDIPDVIKQLERDMVFVEGGTFMMGATGEQASDAWDNEKPVHEVTLSSFHICKHEVTQEEWEAVMGSNPSEFKGAKRPVEQVSWDDCQTFIKKLNHLTGKEYRLPTDAEWEYAARGGRESQGYKYSGSDNLGDVMIVRNLILHKVERGETLYSISRRYNVSIEALQSLNPKVRKNRKVKRGDFLNIPDATYAVMGMLPNNLGLYDMSGNVSEWCSDWYGANYYSSSPQTNPTGPSLGSYRVNRGGSWGINAAYCRVSHRSFNAPSLTSTYLGFRLAQ